VAKYLLLWPQISIANCRPHRLTYHSDTHTLASTPSLLHPPPSPFDYAATSSASDSYQKHSAMMQCIHEYAYLASKTETAISWASIYSDLNKQTLWMSSWLHMSMSSIQTQIKWLTDIQIKCIQYIHIYF